MFRARFRKYLQIYAIGTPKLKSTGGSVIDVVLATDRGALANVTVA